MVHKWRKLEIEVGSAMPIDPMIATNGRWKYLRCPLCHNSCTESYWNIYHSKDLHLKCPICKEWFSKPLGLSQHFAKTQCGLILLGAIATPPHTETILVRYTKA